jgi:hypothetical protein
MSQEKPSRLDVYLQEYDKLKSEQTGRIGFRDNLLYVNLATIGAVLSFVFSKDASGDTPNYVALLIIPWISAILGWTYLINDDKISCLGNYFKEKLSASIQAELEGQKSLQNATQIESQEQELSQEDNLLAWETFNRTAKRRTRRKIEQLLIDELTFSAPGIFAVIAFWHMGGAIAPMVQFLCGVELLIAIGLGVEIFLYAEPWRLFKRD